MRLAAAAALFALALTIVLGACAGPGYYVQAVGGHFRLMHARQDIGEYLRTAPADDPLADRLRIAREILAFAGTDLELPANDSYGSFVDTGREAVVWNVVAAPEFDLAPKRWCFIVAGCVPYRGYFDRARAERAGGRLRDAGYDTIVAPATAYSTLGWFDDPLLDTMLRRSDAVLAGTLFHELAHQQLYVAGDTAFNEAYASFVETVGVERWLRSTGREAQLPEWQARQDAVAEWRDLVAETRGELAVLYASSLDEAAMRSRKADILDDLRRRYRDMVEQRWNGRDRFGAWFAGGPNNASMALVAQYHGGVCAFEALFREAEGDIARFQALAKARADLDEAARKAWLEQPCN